MSEWYQSYRALNQYNIILTSTVQLVIIQNVSSVTRAVKVALSVGTCVLTTTIVDQARIDT